MAAQPVDPTDADVISASLEKPSLFGLIFTRHYPALYNFAARRIGRDEAADLVADTFVRALESRATYDPSYPSCLPWLYGIAQNVIRDRLRRVGRGKRIYIALPAAATEEFGEETDDRVVASSVATDLAHALARLSKRDRSTLLLYALDGFSYSEIALVLDIPAGTVGSRLNRARQQILEAIPDLEQRTR